MRKKGEGGREREGARERGRMQKKSDRELRGQGKNEERGRHKCEKRY